MNKGPHPWGTPPWAVDFRPHAKPLPKSVDFCVIGGGFSGLSAAFWLKALTPDRSVLLLERASLGDGASGRTGGMVLAETAAGDLPGLGDVLGGYRRILRGLRIDSELALPGAFELGRSGGLSQSLVTWDDSGALRVVKKVPGGTVNPGRVVAGLARAAQDASVQIVEHAELVAIAPLFESAATGRSTETTALQLSVRLSGQGSSPRELLCNRGVLLATNAFSLDLSDSITVQPKLTLALATEPLTRSQIAALGLESRRPFYTVDLPYLWGRLMKNDAAIFGSGLVHAPRDGDLMRVDIHRSDAAERMASLENRVRGLHPALKNVQITHRWAGPILLTDGQRPLFRPHPHMPGVTVLVGFNGHGVALSVYLGRWAAEALLGRRELPKW